MTRNAPLFAIARILMAVIFIISGFGKITGFAGTTAWMASMGLPFPAVEEDGTIAHQPHPPLLPG